MLLVATDRGILLIDAEAVRAGVRVEDDSLDTHRGSLVIELVGVPAPAAGAPRRGRGHRAGGRCRPARPCADSLGALTSASEIVTRYLRERDAFGASIASFQVIRQPDSWSLPCSS